MYVYIYIYIYIHTYTICLSIYLCSYASTLRPVVLCPHWRTSARPRVQTHKNNDSGNNNDNNNTNTNNININTNNTIYTKYTPPGPESKLYHEDYLYAI